MRFLSNFDTKLEQQVILKYSDLYGKDNVFCIHRAKIFWVIHCLLPSLGLLIMILVLALIMLFDTGESALNSLKNILGVLAIFLLVFMGGYKILKKYFDYTMDFCVVTTQEVVSYNQTGFLTRASKTIDADKIKTITVNTSGIRKSLFNFGDLVFLSEGDQSGGGDVSLNFVHNVNFTKNKVRDLIEPHLQKHHQNHLSSTEQKLHE